MRRHEYEQFMKGSLLGLLADCVFYCWQKGVITGDESFVMAQLLNHLYIKELQQKGN